VYINLVAIVQRKSGGGGFVFVPGIKISDELPSLFLSHSFSGWKEFVLNKPPLINHPRSPSSRGTPRLLRNARPTIKVRPVRAHYAPFFSSEINFAPPELRAGCRFQPAALFIAAHALIHFCARATCFFIKTRCPVDCGLPLNPALCGNFRKKEICESECSFDLCSRTQRDEKGVKIASNVALRNFNYMLNRSQRIMINDNINSTNFQQLLNFVVCLEFQNKSFFYKQQILGCQKLT